MKKRVFGTLIILFCLCILVGCDPIYPLGELKVVKIEPISQGESINIEIIYPGGDIGVSGWKDQSVEIINGDDIVAVSGLTLTALKSGNATIKVNATTVMYDERDEEKVYSTKIEIKVK